MNNSEYAVPFLERYAAALTENRELAKRNTELATANDALADKAVERDGRRVLNALVRFNRYNIFLDGQSSCRPPYIN